MNSIRSQAHCIADRADGLDRISMKLLFTLLLGAILGPLIGVGFILMLGIWLT